MNIGKAVAICMNIDSKEYSIDDKLLAVHEVLNMPTHMGVNKDTLIGVIKWLWNFTLEVDEGHNGKRIVEISIPHGRLIDADLLLGIFKRRLWKNEEYDYIIGMIERQRTIIEAEDGDDQRDTDSQRV